ncbi:nucleotidyltransferase family protein [Mucilaginibacter rigui]|uniref:Nucleotidyltransferase family protein n=1 Tax=Mucilaginibacter rigui TaxID=534635 RepID=A0ABR7X6L2_9SPHI|nr:nucleotidyltransferase family protein [Mucilaginibacter rigui]MBD1386227.1 nucleotidyltransferase family protein [Mucilaginibacter rigui]
MRNYKDHLILTGTLIIEALIQLDKLAKDAILFVVDEDDKLIGSLTDGDIRRGLIKGLSTKHPVTDIIQSSPRYLRKGESDINKVVEYREANFRIIPILDKSNRVVNVINFRETRSYLPIDAVIMAGGRGQRLKPLTDTTPKPLLKIGDKPIMEHNLDRLALFGIDDFWVSVKYLGEQIENYFGDGTSKNVNIKYVWETEALGTIGAVSKIKDFQHDYVLVTNSDILTNLDYEHLYISFLQKDADFAVVTIPYEVKIPYAVLETTDGNVKSLKEKPTYTYYSNAGIYLMKKDVLSYLPTDTFFDATDLIEKLLAEGLNVVSYPLAGYWLDVGKHDDFEKGQKDITQIKF